MPSEDPGRGSGPTDRDGRDDADRDDGGSGDTDRDGVGRDDPSADDHDRVSSGDASAANGGTVDVSPDRQDAAAKGLGDVSEPPPSPRALQHAFHVTEVRTEGDRVYYFGHALVSADLESAIAPAFENSGYAISHVERAGEDVVVARPATTGVDGFPWTHAILFVLTIGSTLFAGSYWFYVDPVQEPTQIWRGWPFAVGILTVLGVHEMGHYVMTRRHDVDATLPYFIPIPTLIGTMGAVIRMKGHMPDRKALFDIGVAGPIAGLVATVFVTVVGLHLDPVTAPESLEQSGNAVEILIQFPPLMKFLSWATGQPLHYEGATTVHPVVIAGWVGMFVTFLNLIPVGQLDGGHVVRAIAPEYQGTIAAIVPGLLYGLAGYLLLVEGLAPRNVMLWAVWGTIALVVAFIGPATPTDDSSELGTKRTLVGIATLAVGLTCFTPVPIAIAN